MPYSLNPTHPCAPEPLHPDAPTDVQSVASARAFQAWFGDETGKASETSQAHLSPFQDRRAPALPRPRDFL